MGGLMSPGEKDIGDVSLGLQPTTTGVMNSGLDSSGVAHALRTRSPTGVAACIEKESARIRKVSSSARKNSPRFRDALKNYGA